MAKYTRITFEMVDGKGRHFTILFDTESILRNKVQTILFMGLPVCTIDLKLYDAELYKNIINLMYSQSKAFWNHKTELA